MENKVHVKEMFRLSLLLLSPFSVSGTSINTYEIVFLILKVSLNYYSEENYYSVET